MTDARTLTHALAGRWHGRYGSAPCPVCQPAGRKGQNALRRPEVEACTGLSRSTLYDWMKRGEFPQPVKLGTRLVPWRESDVTAWLEALQSESAA